MYRSKVTILDGSIQWWMISHSTRNNNVEFRYHSQEVQIYTRKWVSLNTQRSNHICLKTFSCLYYRFIFLFSTSPRSRKWVIAIMIVAVYSSYIFYYILVVDSSTICLMILNSLLTDWSDGWSSDCSFSSTREIFSGQAPFPFVAHWFLFLMSTLLSLIQSRKVYNSNKQCTLLVDLNSIIEMNYGLKNWSLDAIDLDDLNAWSRTIFGNLPQSNLNCISSHTINGHNVGVVVHIHQIEYNKSNYVSLETSISPFIKLSFNRTIV